MKRVFVSPSILSGDFTAVSDVVRRAEEAGADYLHLDVMDGHFVPNITFGPKMVSDIRKISSLPLDVHLMVQRPELLLDEFLAAGPSILTFHVEATVHAHRLVQRIRERNVRAGVCVIPSTPAAMLGEMIHFVDIVLVMTVNPGFGGQTLIRRTVDKVRELDRCRNRHGLSYRIICDGGINLETAADLREAGADILVSGSAFLEVSDPGEFVRGLRGDLDGGPGLR